MTVRPHIALDPADAPRPSARVATVAGILDCDESDVRRMVVAGTLEAHGHGIRGIRVYLDSVRAYQEAKVIIPKGEKAKPRPRKAPVSAAAHRAAEAALRQSGIIK